MSRARAPRKPVLGEQVASAHIKFSRVTARKTRDLADLIRGLTVGEARQQLATTHRPSAMPTMAGALNSAVANYNDLVRNENIENAGDAENLLVGEIYIDAGPMLKRFRPMSMGRAGQIRKRTCHVTIKLYTQG